MWRGSFLLSPLVWWIKYTVKEKLKGYLSLIKVQDVYAICLFIFYLSLEEVLIELFRYRIMGFRGIQNIWCGLLYVPMCKKDEAWPCFMNTAQAIWLQVLTAHASRMAVCLWGLYLQKLQLVLSTFLFSQKHSCIWNVYSYHWHFIIT